MDNQQKAVGVTGLDSEEDIATYFRIQNGKDERATEDNTEEEKPRDEKAEEM